jgi:hypothetical protein
LLSSSLLAVVVVFVLRRRRLPAVAGGVVVAASADGRSIGGVVVGLDPDDIDALLAEGSVCLRWP